MVDYDYISTRSAVGTFGQSVLGQSKTAAEPENFVWISKSLHLRVIVPGHHAGGTVRHRKARMTIYGIYQVMGADNSHDAIGTGMPVPRMLWKKVPV